MNQPAGKVSATLTAAFQRASLLGLLTFALTTLTSRQQEIGGVALSWEQSLIAGAISGIGVLIARGGFEGGADAGRQAEGAVSAADVQPNGGN